MLTKVGDPIQLNLQLEDGNPSKYPVAILRNQLGVLLPASPVSLTHIGDGLYSDDSVVMPDTQEVTATFKVYEDAGHTILSPFYSVELEIFTKDQSAALIASLIAGMSPGDLTGRVDDLGLMAGFLEDNSGLSGDIEDLGELTGVLEDLELTGTLYDSGELFGETHAC